MDYREFACTPEFAGHVARFWQFASSPDAPDLTDHVIPPDGCASIAVRLAPEGSAVFVSVLGPAAKAHRVKVAKGWTYHGARIRPGAIRGLLGIEAQDLTGRVQPMDDIVPALARRLVQAIEPGQGAIDFPLAFETALRPELANPVDGLVCDLAQQIMQGTGEADMLAAGRLGERQVRRRFVRETGLGPKLFERLVRVRKLCVHLSSKTPPRLTTLAHDLGYADQSHLCRDIREVFGQTPQALAERIRQISHHAVV